MTILKFVKKIFQDLWQKIMQNKLLSIILFSALIYYLIWAGIWPLWQPWDEAAHFQYTQQMAEYKKLPRQDYAIYSHELEGTMAILATHPLAKEKTQKFTEEQQKAAKEKIDKLDTTFNRQNGSTRVNRRTALVYPPLYYFGSSLIYRLFYSQNIFTRAYAIRILSVILAVFSLYFIWRAAYLIIPKKLFAATATILVGFQPMYAAASTGINNDSLLNLAGAALIFASLLVIKKGLNYKTATWLGLILGIGALTKPQFSIFILILPVLFIILLLGKKNNLKQIFGYLFWAGLIFALISGWWYLRNYILHYGTVTGVGWEKNFRVDIYAHLSALKYLFFLYGTRYRFVFNYFWSRFGYANTPLPEIYIFIFNTLLKISLVGIIIYFVKVIYKRGKSIKDNLINKYKYILVLLAFFLILDTGYAIVYYGRLVNYGMITFPAQGRYYFSILSVMMILFILGLQQFFPKKYHNWLYAFLSLGMVSYALIALFQYIIPRYYLI